MFLRGKEPEASVWRRFRTGLDGFTFTHEDGYYAARVNANAERVVDLFHALTEQLPPAVDVAVEDLRTARRWTGGNVALPDVREAIARLKVVLTAHAGVEVAVFTDEDQVTLSPHLELYVYSRTDQWFYVLRGKGLEHRESMRERSWRLRPDQFAPAPELEALLEQVVDRLALVSA
jgi:hypothetical protein